MCAFSCMRIEVSSIESCRTRPLVCHQIGTEKRMAMLLLYSKPWSSTPARHYRTHSCLAEPLRPTAGVGSRTAFHLARMGAKVIMACRSVERGEMARAKMEQELAILRSGTGKTSRAVRAGTLEVQQ